MGCLRTSTLLMGLALLSGCATSGPNHVYLTKAGGRAVHDLGPPPGEIAGALAPGEQALGLAYDFNTDHLFVRLARSIRVIERPSGKILREMPLPPELRTNSLPRSVPEDTAPADIRPDEGRWTDPVRPAGLNRAPRTPGREQQGADLAIRSSDRHLFAVHPDGRSVVELTLFGEFVRRIELSNPESRINGLACDQRQPRLLVLSGDAVRAYAYDGRELGSVPLQAAVQPVSLGYDSETGHCFVPLADGKSLGEFAADGRLLTTVPTGPITALDAGPRSLVRVF